MIVSLTQPHQMPLSSRILALTARLRVNLAQLQYGLASWLLRLTVNVNDRNTTLRAWLRRCLIKVPYWSHGHLEFAKLSIQISELAYAYSSALAVLELSKDLKERAAAQHVLGKCFLGKSDFDSAQAYLERSAKFLPENFELKEDLAACYMGQKKFAEALNALVAIPQAQLSSSAKAVFEFLKSKQVIENDLSKTRKNSD